MKQRWVIPGALACGVAGVVAVGALSGPKRPVAQAAAETAGETVSIEVVRPERRDLVRQTRLPGTVRPWEETQLYAKVSGYLQRILVDKGDVVKRGQLLAVLDVPEMGDDLAQQRVQEAAARVRSREPVVSLETARAEVERADGEVAAAQAVLDGVRAELEAAEAAALEPASLLAAVRAETAAARAAAQEPSREVETAEANLRAAQEDLRATEAEVDRYQADFELRDRTYQRFKRLRERDVVTQQELEQHEAAYSAAKAALVTAKGRVSAMRERIAAGRSAVRAAQARVATAEARAVTPEARVPSIEAKTKTARARVVATEKAVRTAEAGVQGAKDRVRVARARLTEAEARVATARTDVSVAAAGARRVRTMVRYAQLTAPYDGVVTQRYVDTGQLIQAATSGQSQPVLVVSHIDRVRVTVPVSEPDVPHLRVGRAVTLTVRELPGKRWVGKVSRYTSDLDPQARTMMAEIDLPNRGRALRPGMFAEVVVDLETHAGALSVPSSAVVAEKQKRSLWVVRDGRAQKIEVHVGVDNGVEAEILDGIDAEESVIVSGQSSLKPDQAVRSVPARRWSSNDSEKRGH